MRYSGSTLCSLACKHRKFKCSGFVLTFDCSPRFPIQLVRESLHILHVPPRRREVFQGRIELLRIEPRNVTCRQRSVLNRLCCLMETGPGTQKMEDSETGARGAVVLRVVSCQQHEHAVVADLRARKVC